MSPATRLSAFLVVALAVVLAGKVPRSLQRSGFIMD